MRIDIPKGWSISLAIEYAKDYTRNHRMNYVTFDFNDIELTVYIDSSIYDICYIYQLEQKIRRISR